MMKMSANNAVPTNNEIQKQQAIQALHFAQITNDYQQFVKNIACDFYEDVVKIFPDHLQMVYLLTSARRRQVWNAVIASESTRKVLERNGKEIVALRHDLLEQKASVLLKSAFNELPSSFEALLSRFGSEAQDPDVYLKLFELAQACEPRLRQQLLNEQPLRACTVRRLHALPTGIRNVRFAKSLQYDAQVGLFVRLLEEMNAIDFPDKDVLQDRLFKTIHRSGDVSSIIKDIYVRLPFPSQLVPDCERVRFLKCGLDLEQAGKRFDNCLGILVPQAIRGERQFYEWNGNAIVSLHKHRGSWKVEEIKLSSNREPAARFQKMIIDHFANHGVKSIQDFPALLEPFLLKGAFRFEDPQAREEDGMFDMSYFMDAA
jgi:hypothetical protein